VLYLFRIPVRFHDPAKTDPRPGEGAFVQALYDGRGFLERFREHQGLAFSFAVNSQGRLLAYPTVEPVLARKDMSGLEPIKQAMQQDFSVQQTEFTMDGKRYLGIYQKTNLGGLIVISMTDKAAALAARGLLLEKTLYLSLFIFTIVFLISLVFASSLSTPLMRLVSATREIAHGNFDAEIPVDTGDEIGTLARSFSQMGSELKSSRLLLEQYNAELETKVQTRTEELEKKNADISHQQEVLLRATRLAAVGEIAGQAAHEVLNPLTAMISRLESVSMRVQEFAATPSAPLPALRTILQDWGKDYREGGIEALARALEKPSQVLPGKKMADEDLENLSWIGDQFEALNKRLGEDLELLLKESHRIGRIVDGMRGLSRASKIKTRTNLGLLISDCVRVSEDLLKRHKIWIETKFDDSDIWVQIDQDEMRQVFSNLIKNALDAIDPVIHERQLGLILIHAFIDKERLVHVRLRDNGMGISPESRARMFEADFSTKGVHGTGFGLSICRRFVREAGGELIVLDSVPGSHTEFEITLPLAAPETVG
jgi:signal transduction histidine kinase